MPLTRNGLQRYDFFSEYCIVNGEYIGFCCDFLSYVNVFFLYVEQNE